MRRAEIVRRAALDYPNALRLRGISVRDSAVPAGYAEGDRRPVVLIPGVYETWHFLRPVADVLSARGHPIHVVTGLGVNRRPIPVMAEVVGAALAARDLRGVAVVAHSKGGLIGKLAMTSREGARIDRLVALASPFAGSVMANWMVGSTLRAFRPAHPVIRSLVAQTEVNARITSIYPRYDPHIPAGSRLEGAHNVELDLVGHFGLLRNAEAIAAAIAAVERESPTGV